MKEFDDWAEHMIWAEKNLKEIELGLTNRQFDGLQLKIIATIRSLTHVSDWLDRHAEQAE